MEASRERTYCGATAEYREEPELQFDPPIPACPGGGWRDWHNVAVLAADPAVDFQALQERLRDSVELLGTDILPDRSTSPQLDALRLKPGKALLLSKVGEDGDQNEDELFSLLARTSNSDVIVLVSARLSFRGKPWRHPGGGKVGAAARERPGRSCPNDP